MKSDSSFEYTVHCVLRSMITQKEPTKINYSAKHLRRVRSVCPLNPGADLFPIKFEAALP